MTARDLTLYAAVAANIAIAVTKFVAAAVTGSSSMLSEAIHSVVDTGDGLLVLLGLRLSHRPPSPRHPYGHGLEVYFWSMIVAMSIFGMGGVVSIYEGIARMRHPHHLGSATLGLVVLACSFVFEGISWLISMKSFGRVRGRKSLWKAIEQSKDPTTFVVVLEDSAALVGILIAAAGLALAKLTHEPRFDAAGSILIGLLLVTSGFVLGRETWSLMIGESASPALVDDIQRIASQRSELADVHKPRTLHLGPDQIHVDLDIHAHADVTAKQLGELLKWLESAVHDAHPEVQRLSIRLI
ncbi:MAG TPA: cation diffusion facilitator family transporter [Kofleriaceae bacterium]|nr:cation diffusion facilitator family transporter [Kofleriaceae bacterium]